jgi:YVTN family beta-propeller protein
VNRIIFPAALMAIVAVVVLNSMTGTGRADKTEGTVSNATVNGSWAPRSVGHPTFVSPHASPITVSDGRVFVVNTPADTVDVIDANSQIIVARVHVGIDPVSLAVRPDGREVWVANHVSDSVSVIDNDRESPTYLNVIATVQDIDAREKSTRFDEPVGIAFASNEKAYVALSSENTIAVINVATRQVQKRLSITAQDPRAIVVRGGLLYVIPFESNNQTQLSGGTGKIDGQLVTFNAHEHSIANNNVLSLGHVVDIVKHPKVPDRDLYVFDTETDELVEVVDTLGTLLYGLTVDSKGQVFIAQTDARNEVNGRAGTKQHGLAELENRAFLNRVTRVSWATDARQRQGDSARRDSTVDHFELEPLPPEHPQPGRALATPFAIEISADDSTLVVSAAASDKLFTIDSASGEVLGRVDVGAVPHGIALQQAEGENSLRAWVYNAAENSVSLVDLADWTSPQLVNTTPLEDPTHPVVKRGRIAFETAAASTTGTYACASCHPDGHTDQLLWVLKTPVVTGGDQIMPRSTMPVRGLRDTAPFHWDGIPGDPYGGNNSANIHSAVDPNCDLNDPASSTRHLIDGGIAGTMSMVGDTTVNDEGKAGALTAAQRDAMATFLLSVPYPPAQRRAYTNTVSDRAVEGFKLFHIDGDHDGKPRPNVCGNCHRMPFLVSTNTPGTGMDAPTWRGAYDRFLILPQGRLNIIDFDFYRRVAEAGQSERSIWQFSWGGRRRFDPVWEMVLEGSTGFSGSFARQVSLNATSAQDDFTSDLLQSLERSADEGAVVLEAEGVFIEQSDSEPVALQFDGELGGGRYIRKHHDGSPQLDSERFPIHDKQSFTRVELVSLALNGGFVSTFTARHGAEADVDSPQPAIWTLGPIERQRGRQVFPIVHDGNLRMKISGRHISEHAHVILDGRRVPGSTQIGADETVEVVLQSLPTVGIHLLQLQNPNGMFSNDFIFHVTENSDAAADLKRRTDEAHVGLQGTLSDAVSRGDLARMKELLASGAKINGRQSDGGGTPLSTAAFHGRLESAKFLIENGAKVDATNADGNTPLHVAAFMCRFEIVELLLDSGAPVDKKSGRGETPTDVVSAPWSEPLAGFYRAISGAAGLEIDLEQIQRDRPRIAKLLHSYADKLDGTVGWQRLHDMPVEKWEAGTVLLDKKLYFFGGYTDGVRSSKRCDVFDPSDVSWKRIQDLPSAITHMNMVLDGRTVWFAGGFKDGYKGHAIAEVWNYDIENDRYTAAPLLPEPRGGGGLALVEGKLHYLGGVQADRDTDAADHWVLDLKQWAGRSAKWENAAPMPAPRNQFSTVTLEGKIYAIGGQFHHDSMQLDQPRVDIYDPRTDSWTSGPALPKGHSHSEGGTFVDGERILMVGGHTTAEGERKKISAQILALLPGGQWEVVGTLPSQLSSPVARIIDGKLYVAGGSPDGRSVQADMWVSQL